MRKAHVTSLIGLIAFATCFPASRPPETASPATGMTVRSANRSRAPPPPAAIWDWDGSDRFWAWLSMAVPPTHAAATIGILDASGDPQLLAHLRSALDGNIELDW